MALLGGGGRPVQSSAAGRREAGARGQSEGESCLRTTLHVERRGGHG